MISYKQSKKLLKNSKILIRDELIKSNNCINRVAAENVLSKADNPAGNNAAFDGYAINSKDTNGLNKKKVKKNQHVRFKGSDYKKNDLLIKKGTILQSNHILALKTLGIKNTKEDLDEAIKIIQND